MMLQYDERPNTFHASYLLFNLSFL